MAYIYDEPVPASEFSDPAYSAILHGLLYMSASTKRPPAEYEPFISKYRARYRKEHGRELRQEVSSYVIPAYEAVYLYANAVGTAVRSGVDYRDGREMMRVIANLSFGLLGETVQLNADFGRDVDYTVYNWLVDEVRAVGDYSLDTDRFSFYEQIVWTGNTTQTPVDVDAVVGILVPRTGWDVFDEIAPAMMLAFDEVPCLGVLLCRLLLLKHRPFLSLSLSGQAQRFNFRWARATIRVCE
jgi:hypothetical protein